MRGTRTTSRALLGRRPVVVGALGLCLLVPWGGAGRGHVEAARAAPTARTPLPHDLHLSYADLALEGAVLAGRVRLFKDDLERALGRRLDADALALTPGPEADALVGAYLREHLEVEADGRPLPLTLLDAGEDELDREPVWWALVHFRAPDPIAALRVRNTLLFDLFDDQRNVLKVVRFPERASRTYSFDPREPEHRLLFGGSGAG